VPVSAQETIFHHVGNGLTVTFAYGCQVLQAADLKVYLNDVLVTSGYAVSGIGVLTGGVVTFDAAPANLAKVRLERDIALERTTDYQQNGDFLARVVNPDFNRIWMALQQHLTVLNRALLVPKSDAASPSPLPTIANRADKLLGFDTNGNPVAVTPAPQSATALSILLATPNGVSYVGNATDQRELASATGAALIGFIQNAVGAVVRSLQDKNSDIVSAFDFMTEAQKADVRARTFAVDVTAPLQACLDHCHTKGRTMFAPGGGYRITAQLNKPSSFKFPNIVGEGFGATEFRSYGLAADTSILFGVGGSGGLAGAIISGITFSSDDGLANAIEFDGQCGVTIRDCKFGKLAIGVLPHNKSAGSFTEVVVVENCDFSPDCRENLVYRRTGGNDSFHGTGVRDITSTEAPGATLPKIRIGGTGSTSNDIIVYNAPLSGQFWKNAAIPVIQNNSTRFATNFHGNITLELFAGAQGSTWDVCSGANRTYLLGTISSLQPYTRRGQLVLCDTFETRTDGSVSALRKPYQLAPLAMVSGANNIATLSVVTNETYLVRVEFADSASAAKKTYLLCVNFAQNAPASVATLATLLDYFGGSMPYPAFSITDTTLVATAAFAATVSCSVTVTKIGISSAFGL
jgi:hypothetical protein